MKKRKKKEIDPDMPIGKLIEVPDFLPPPSELAKAETKIIVTMALDAETIAFFKREAKKKGAKYQKMMREALKRYADHYRDKDAA
jgi:predicted DNA binding CopG/RHH family protein